MENASDCDDGCVSRGGGGVGGDDVGDGGGDGDDFGDGDDGNDVNEDVHNEQEVRRRPQVLMRRRRPSERIINAELAKRIGGKGSSADIPFDI